MSGAGHSLPSVKRYVDEDMEGAEFRECNLNNTRLIGVIMQDAVIDGLVTNLVVNGVEVMGTSRPSSTVVTRSVGSSAPTTWPTCAEERGSCALTGRRRWRVCGNRPASSARA
jgi:hypothetical protein